MNFYKFLSNFKGKQIPHVFPAINIRDAYEKAGRIIIDEYPNISDYSADILDTSNLDNWKSKIIPEIKIEENITLSDILELDEE